MSSLDTPLSALISANRKPKLGGRGPRQARPATAPKSAVDVAAALVSGRKGPKPSRPSTANGNGTSIPLPPRKSNSMVIEQATIRGAETEGRSRANRAARLNQRRGLNPTGTASPAAIHMQVEKAATKARTSLGAAGSSRPSSSSSSSTRPSTSSPRGGPTSFKITVPVVAGAGAAGKAPVATTPFKGVNLRITISTSAPPADIAANAQIVAVHARARPNKYMKKFMPTDAEFAARNAARATRVVEPVGGSRLVQPSGAGRR